ncbi:hypothetical protein Sjap_004321 [Stephania japonica]|uniref:Uncharacterized protein n=1 Tax=Stephania japonica TaxID=461633 RepID=A0AAP0K230_9MAGN
MDLETENRIAAILMKEAAELHRQAEREGVHAYLQQRKVRTRPNSRFLTATVLGVQQANRAEEIREMWRVRRNEVNLDNKRGNSRDESSRSHGHYSSSPTSSSSRRRHSSKIDDDLPDYRKRGNDHHLRDDSLENEEIEDDSLGDEDIEEFLNSRVKRGRGTVGSRMDETGPYLPPSDSNEKLLDTRVREDWEDRIVGPEKPAFLKSQSSFDYESEKLYRKKAKKDEALSLTRPDSKKHKRKEDKHKHKKRKYKKQKRCSKSID